MKSLKSNNLGKKYLTDQCQSIDISSYLRGAKGQLKELVIGSEIEADGFKIGLITSNTHYQGLRYWFKCPLCGKRAGKLYKHPVGLKLGCRGCLGLEYRSRRYKGMVENSI
jgi:hypothetical protein